MKTPCKNCPRRKVGCHTGCPEYDAFLAERALVRKRIMELQEAGNAKNWRKLESRSIYMELHHRRKRGEG